ncbi:MAG: amino acid permease [Ignavibacteriae bacterium]|nr:amino acid permease [Ignavibacteriota bacterium]MCB9242749.1 amino acid permease [Ignavibacteriales bacterium]
MSDQNNGSKLPLKTLGVFTLAMINVAAIVSLRNLPLMADYGFASVFFYVLAGLIFFIPISLVAAEFATTYPGEGGIYLWVKEAFGQQYGFLTVWMEWVLNAVWLPTVLSFTAATIAYIITPELAQNKVYMVAVMLIVLWGTTFANFFGMKASGIISSVGTMTGTIIPGALIIILGILWFVLGNPSQITFSVDTLIPDMKLDNLVFFAGVIVGLAGIEMAAFHANEAKDPQKDYPKAIFLSASIILALFILGSLAIAIVVPAKEISLVAGLMQAFESFFSQFGMKWFVKVIAFLTAIGALAQISTWLIGPSKGILATAQDGSLPKVFKKVNKDEMPVGILIIQALIGSLFSLIFLIAPDVSSSYWILTALTAQLTVIMYMLIFSAIIKLRYSQPDIKRPFQIPGGKAGVWTVAGIGLIGCVFTLVLGFIPPDNVPIKSVAKFEAIMIGGVVILSIPPFIFHSLNKRKEKANETQS